MPSCSGFWIGYHQRFNCCVLSPQDRYMPFLLIFHLLLVISLISICQFCGVDPGVTVCKHSSRHEQPLQIFFSHIGFVSTDFTWFVLHSVFNDLCMYLTQHWSVYTYDCQTKNETLPSSLSSLSSSSTTISCAGNFVCMNMFLHTWLGFLHGCCKCAYSPFLRPREIWSLYCCWSLIVNRIFVLPAPSRSISSVPVHVELRIDIHGKEQNGFVSYFLTFFLWFSCFGEVACKVWVCVWVACVVMHFLFVQKLMFFCDNSVWSFCLWAKFQFLGMRLVQFIAYKLFQRIKSSLYTIFII